MPRNCAGRRITGALDMKPNSFFFHELYDCTRGVIVDFTPELTKDGNIHPDELKWLREQLMRGTYMLVPATPTDADFDFDYEEDDQT